jgi:hypothetical protein
LRKLLDSLPWGPFQRTLVVDGVEVGINKYFAFSSPYGRPHPSLDRDEYYLCRKTGEERHVEKVIKFRNRRHYTIDQAWPLIHAQSLTAIIRKVLAGGYTCCS